MNKSARDHLFLSEEDWTLLITILNRYPGIFYAYGSRTKGDHTAFSDLDLCVEGDVDLIQLKADLEDSDLPIKVDVTPIQKFKPDFLAHIEKNFIRIR